MVEFIKYTGFDHAFQFWGPWVWYMLAVYLSLPLIAYFILPYLSTKRTIVGNKRSASVFAVGDLGHSPRMCYHSRSLLKLDYTVTLCGYVETAPPDDIIDDVNIDIRPLSVLKNEHLHLPYLVFLILKVVFQTFQFFQSLFEVRGTDFIIIQNPPSMPLLAIVLLFTKTFSRNTKVVIDWHNLNYTILNLKYHNLNHPLIRLLRYYEKYLGKRADYHITVTRKMKNFLIEEMGFSPSRISVLYDRPAEQFTPSMVPSRRLEMLKNHPVFEEVENIENYKIVVSATSFTPDEDMTILLKALKDYDNSISNRKLPPLFVLVTGKGPLKNHFLKSVESLNFLKNVVVRNAWLSAEDYPLVLATADIGVSLHTSSSGIDFPMKILDYFGCGVPVIALRFLAIDEVVKNQQNGLITEDDTKKEESEQVFDMLAKLFSTPELYDIVKEGALLESQSRWSENWQNKLKKLFV